MSVYLFVITTHTHPHPCTHTRTHIHTHTYTHTHGPFFVQLIDLFRLGYWAEAIVYYDAAIWISWGR